MDDGTTWWRVSVWNHLAEQCAEKIARGMRVTVSGTAKLREYEKDGQTRASLEVTAQDVSLPLPKFAPRGDGDVRSASGGQFSRPSQADDPWGSAPQQSSAFAPADSEPPF